MKHCFKEQAYYLTSHSIIQPKREVIMSVLNLSENSVKVNDNVGTIGNVQNITRDRLQTSPLTFYLNITGIFK